jgi:hypothetical protein
VDYFEAVQQGRKRVSDAVAILEEVAGPSYPMLFLQIGVSPWTPVGGEMLQKLVPGKGEMSALVICDSKGNAKAMSAWLPTAEALNSSRSLERRGIPEFPGNVRLPV